MNLKQTIKTRFYTRDNLLKVAYVAVKVFRIKTFFGIRTRGLSSLNALALNNLLDQLPKGLLAILLIREEDFLEEKLQQIRLMSLREPENHIFLFLQTDRKLGKVYFGATLSEKFDGIIDSEKMKEVYTLFEDAQYLEGVDSLVKLIKTRL